MSAPDHTLSHSRRARAALARMPEVDPAISALALWCAHRDGAGATRTADDVIIYGPDFETLPLAEQTGVVAHHVLHVALRHSRRRADMALRQGPGFEARLYNLASDAIVNEALVAGGHAIPRPAALARELVAALLQSKNRPASGSVLIEWDTDRLYLALMERSGAGEDGAREAAEAYAEACAFEPDLEPSEAAGGGGDEGPDVWSERLEQAADAGRAAGLGIGLAVAGLADLPEAIIPWERKLRRLVTRAVSEVPRQSWKRPANRWVAREAAARSAGGPGPVFEPGFARDRMRPRIVVGLDTSSSITELQMQLFAAEALSISNRTGAEVHLLGFDVDVHTRVRLESAEQLARMTFRRDGGTSFAEVIEAAAELRPSILVMLTDLDAPFGPAPDFPVVWAAPVSCPEPPFGVLLMMDR